VLGTRRIPEIDAFTFLNFPGLKSSPSPVFVKLVIPADVEHCCFFLSFSLLGVLKVRGSCVENQADTTGGSRRFEDIHCSQAEDARKNDCPPVNDCPAERTIVQLNLVIIAIQVLDIRIMAVK